MAEAARVSVWVRPNARRSEIADFQDGVLQVRVAAPPVEGKANKELVEFLSKVLGVSKSRLTIEKGVNGRKKVVRIDDCTPEQVLRQLAGIANDKK